MVQNEDALLAFAQRFQRCLGRLVGPAARAAGRLLVKVEEEQHIIFSAPLANIGGEVFHVLRIEVDFRHAAEGGVKCRHIKGMLASDHGGIDFSIRGFCVHIASLA